MSDLPSGPGPQQGQEYQPESAAVYKTRPGYRGDGTPRFGRLLVVLIIAVMMVVAITAGSQAYFTP